VFLQGDLSEIDQDNPLSLYLLFPILQYLQLTIARVFSLKEVFFPDPADRLLPR